MFIVRDLEVGGSLVIKPSQLSSPQDELYGHILGPTF